MTEQLLDARTVDITPYLICTKRGLPYYNEETGSCSGWDSIWSRFMKRALKETALKDKFTMHDLRAKCASDIKDEKDAQKLLAHANLSMTKRYRRKVDIVLPGR
ncbi:MAG: tyrosine-type recombinase/integrase [Alphaproteobacteria bacterium]|nr:tyrosine-type recombinase/integrase [Alphaproteobacteria bacterium]